MGLVFSVALFLCMLHPGVYNFLGWAHGRVLLLLLLLLGLLFLLGVCTMYTMVIKSCL